MPELRRDPLLQQWVVIAPERGRRPVDPTQGGAAAWTGDGADPFVAGHEDKTPPEVFAIRAPGTAPNTPGWDVRVVPNPFPALKVEGVLDPRARGLFDRLNGIGAHEVIIETPQPDVDISDLPPAQVEKVLQAYVERIKDLRRDFRLRYHLVLRNRGRGAGASLRHAHSQLIATPFVPPGPEQRLNAARDHYARKRRSLFADILDQERESGERVVLETQHFIALCPYASRFPFELTLFPLRQCHDLVLATEDERHELAAVLGRLLRAVRAALGDPAYNYTLYNAPSTVPRPGQPQGWQTLAEDYRWHLEIVPRVQPTASIEWSTGFYINAVAPEEAAAHLRTLL